MNTRENFWNVYCLATNQIKDETLKDNSQTTALISHDLTQNNELAFCSTRNLQFYHFSNTEIFLSRFRLWYPQRIDMTFYGKAMFNQEDRISRSDTARQRV